MFSTDRYFILQGGIRGHLPRSNIAYQGGVNAREGNDFYAGYSSAGPRSELRMSQLHQRYSAGFNQANAQTLPSSGQSYGDILERVRYTMHTTGSISDALGRSKLGSGAQSNLNIAGTTSSEFRRSGGTASGPLNQISVNASGNGIVSRDEYSGMNNVQVVSGQLNGNALNKVTRDVSFGGEEENQPASQLP